MKEKTATKRAEEYTRRILCLQDALARFEKKYKCSVHYWREWAGDGFMIVFKFTEINFNFTIILGQSELELYEKMGGLYEYIEKMYGYYLKQATERR